eukprot:CAMPEP_0174705092 /NCGR_PEP_ID=MMETSP1094-20130205/8433_1 /TAXON_ID=156173 /ORGANISM="Chrysochromulina brevifilum, Strain UTEX LB 985" /LENGTH=385 /DNA_ID=CAMNT_0015903213 /DNA_START=47 /DNA_END=1204 /DNA_ORIENTATION=-
MAGQDLEVQPPVCTTLCLWEPDAHLMIRKAKGQERARKSEYAAEARKGAFVEAASESGVSEEIRAFEEHFAIELRAARDTMEQVMALSSADGETPKLFDWWLEQLTELHTLVSSATSFLPTQLRQRFGNQIADHEAKLKAERERLTPKKKFAFKKRDKVAAKTTSAPEAAPPPPTASEAANLVPTGGGVAHVPKADTFQAPAGCQGFRDRVGATLIRPAGEEAAGDFALEELTDCEVRLLSSSAVLWIRNLSNCRIFALPVARSIYVTACEGCTLYLGSRQLRIHTSSRTDFYVHTTSHPIIEHCSSLRFAPYPALPPNLQPAFDAVGIKPELNQWQLVDDFDWLKASHSPNWTELAEGQRVGPAFLENTEKDEGEAVELAVKII